MSTYPSVLVVEDNPTQQKLIELLGPRCHFSPVVVGSGDELMDKLMSMPLEQFQLILMDWQLSNGELDGIECTRLIRQMETGSGRHIPIIGVTAYAMDGDRAQCLHAGMDDYLAKPFTIDQLEDMLNKWLNPVQMI